MHVQIIHPIAQEVFNGIINNKSTATQPSAIQTAEGFSKRIMKTNFPTIMERESYTIEVCKRLSIEEFLLFCETEDAQTKHSFQRKLMTNEPFLTLALKSVSFIYKINYQAMRDLRDKDRNAYEKITDSVLLAGMYLALIAENK